MDKKLNALKAEHWKQVLHRYNLARQETGISKAEWCNQNGIGVKSLYRWQKALRLEAAEQFLPIQQDIVPVLASLWVLLFRMYGGKLSGY